MRLGAFTILFLDRSYEACVQSIAEAGCDCIEVGCGGFIYKTHCDPLELLADRGKLREWRKVIDEAGLEISAFSCHANMLHPDPRISKQHIEDFHNAVRLAAEIGVDRVVTFAGCPGDSNNASQPNWVTCPWPNYFTEILNWQWEQKIIPFWHEQSHWLQDNGNIRVGLEMHPGDAVYTPEKLLKLRNASGENIWCAPWETPSSTCTPRIPGLSRITSASTASWITSRMPTSRTAAGFSAPWVTVMATTPGSASSAPYV